MSSKLEDRDVELQKEKDLEELYRKRAGELETKLKDLEQKIVRRS